MNPSLLSHSRFSANPDGRIVLLCSAQPRSVGFEPVGRGPTLGSIFQDWANNACVDLVPCIWFSSFHKVPSDHI